MLDTIERNTDIPNINAHRFRHLAATVSSAGANIKAVQSLLRHKDPGTTLKVYAANTRKNAELAIAALEKIDKV